MKALIEQCRRLGVRLWVEGGALAYDAPKGAMTPDLIADIKAHKPELLAALSGKINRWRVTLASGQVTEHSSAGLTRSEALDLARCFGEPVSAEPFRLTTPSTPADLGVLLTEACQGVEGIDPATFLTLLSPEDAADIEGGHIPMVTLNAYARSFAEGICTGRITVLAAAIPKTALPLRVRCIDCWHFERDTVGDGVGIGRCKVGGEGTGPKHPALWANAERECKDFARED